MHSKPAFCIVTQPQLYNDCIDFLQVTEVFKQRNTDGANIKVTITLTNELPPSSPQCLQVYNIVFRR